MTPAYIPVELRRQVRTDAGRRCGYCQSPEVLTGFPLDIEHIIPEAAGGPTVRKNLWLACHRCNQFKSDRIQAIDPLTGDRVSFFNPRIQIWSEHLEWSPDGTLVVGVTPCGRATVDALRLNNEYVVAARRFWVEAGWWPPQD